ncbi:MAG: HAMP domain-containing protein [archaeon]
MRIGLLTKIIFLLLIVTILPLCLLGYLVVNDMNSMSKIAEENVNQIGRTAVLDSTNSLNNLGAEIIKQKAIDIARQLEIYVKSNPDKRIEDLQEDEFFQTIAVQPVGKTGYTAITDVETLVCRFHSNPRIVNMDLHDLAAKLPGFWSVMSKTQGGIVSEGYYDWAEPDGSLAQKYMYIAMVNATTADNVRLSVAATTYITEFNAPVKETEAKLNTEVSSVISNINKSALFVQAQAKTIIAITCFVVIIIGILFAGSFVRPMKKLTKAGNEIAEGNLGVEMPSIKSNDEIQDLSNTMSLMAGALKFLREEKKPKNNKK